MIKKMKKISTKLITSFIIVAIISSISGILGVYLLNDNSSRYEYALVNYGFAQGSIGHLGMALNENRAWIRDIVYLSDQKELNAANESIKTNSADIDNFLIEVEKTNTSDAAKTLFTQMVSEIADYRISRDKIIALGMANDEEAARDTLINEAMPKINAIVEKTEQLMAMNTSEGSKESVKLNTTSKLASIIVICVSLISFVISILLAFSISKSISRPIIQVEKASKQLAIGDLNIHLETDLHDEVGSMIHSFNDATEMLKSCIDDIGRGLQHIANGNFDISASADFKGDLKGIENSIDNIVLSLSKTLYQINVASDQVASGSDQVSSGAQALSQGATEQASSVEELSATISDISIQVKQNAQRTLDANTKTGTVGEEIMDSNTQMKSMIEAMAEINESSNQIGKIIKTIEDIAFQTNILALNAAVEAARAGAAGKGFAVVADEVRNLASKSQEAAKNTTLLIQGSIEAVNRGSKIAEATAKSLESVVSGAEEITRIIALIANATNEQSQSIIQVTVGVDQIASVVQNNSATAEESAATSEELSGQAQVMRDLVGKFTLCKR